MKNIYKKILILSVISAVITLVCVEMALLPDVLSARNSGISMLNSANTKVSSGEALNDMQGYGVIVDGIGGTLGVIGSALILFLCIMVAVAIITYVVLHFISWSLFQKNETKNKVTTSLVLTGISCMIQIIIIFKLTDFLIGNTMTSFGIKFLIADISQIVSIVLILIILFLNRNKIKEMYSKKEQV